MDTLGDLEKLVNEPILSLSDLGDDFKADVRRPRDGNWEMLVDSHPDVIAEEAYQVLSAVLTGVLRLA